MGQQLSNTEVLVGDGEGSALSPGAGHRGELALVVVGRSRAVSTRPSRLASALTVVAITTAIATVGAARGASRREYVSGVGGLKEALDTAVRNRRSVRIVVLTHCGDASQSSNVLSGLRTPKLLASGDNVVVLVGILGLESGANIDRENGRRRRSNRGRRGNGLRRSAVRETLALGLGIAVAATLVIVTQVARQVIAPAVVEVGVAVVKALAGHRVVTSGTSLAAALVLNLTRELSRIGVPAPAVIDSGGALGKAASEVLSAVRVQEVLAVVRRAAAIINNTSGPAILVVKVAERQGDNLSLRVGPEAAVNLTGSGGGLNAALAILLHGVGRVNEPLPAVLASGLAVLKTPLGGGVLEALAATGVLETRARETVAIVVDQRARSVTATATVAESGTLTKSIRSGPAPSAATRVIDVHGPTVVVGNLALRESTASDNVDTKGLGAAT